MRINAKFVLDFQVFQNTFFAKKSFTSWPWGEHKATHKNNKNDLS